MLPKPRVPTGLPHIAMRSLSLHPLFALLVGLALVFASGSAFANDTVRVHVDVIVANNDGTDVDPALRAHAKQLRTQFRQFTNFRRASARAMVLTVGESQRIDLPGKGEAFFTFKGVEASQYIIQIKVPGGQTTLKARAGGMMFIGGPRAPTGTILLLIQVK